MKLERIINDANQLLLKKLVVAIISIFLVVNLDVEIGREELSGGMSERICLVEIKDRFHRPTVDGWASLLLFSYSHMV